MTKRSKKQKQYLALGITVSIIITLSFPFTLDFVLNLPVVYGDFYLNSIFFSFVGLLLSPVVLFIGIITSFKITRPDKKISLFQKICVWAYILVIPSMLLVSILLRQYYDPRNSIMVASATGDIKEVLKILENKPKDINKTILYQGERTYALLEAIKNDHTDISKQLIDYGVDINLNEYPPIVYAARLGRYEVVNLLLENGADIEAKLYDATALMAATEKGNIEVVKLLIKNGANVNTTQYESFVLNQACGNSQFEIANLLITNGADESVLGEYGCVSWKERCK